MASVVLRVRATPRSDRNVIVRVDPDLLHVRVRAAPVDGAANRALVELIAEALSVPRSAVSVVRGAAARTKTLEISGLDESQAQQRLAGALSAT